MSYDFAPDPVSPNPSSPPGMTTSKSSKSSSFQSLHSDEGSVLADASHFEDIGLDDDNATLKAAPRPPLRRDASPATLAPRSLAGARPGPRPRQSYPNLRSHSMTSNPRSTSLAALSDPRPLSLPRLKTGSRSTTSLPLARKQRSPSPNISLSPNPRDPSLPHRPRRASSQTNRDRKSFSELEHECDEDDGDDIPEGLVLDNVPISPRPVNDRPPSRAPSVSPSPDRAPKERVRSVGNGTPAIAQAQGSLRSPTWKTDGLSPLSDSHKPRVQSWNAVHAGLSAETKALTEKLEEHADDLDHDYNTRSAGSGRPNTWNPTGSSSGRLHDKKERVKSSTPELPPLRRTNIMIDPLPVSKEKEAVLSRTRPSWLPPKDPAEEKKHIKEYQKMMAASIKAVERRDAERKQQLESRDHAADDLMRMWETTIMPRWDIALQERSTRELWWQGIPPRSRGAVWSRALGNTLELSQSSFDAALERALALEARVREDRASPEDLRKFKWLEQLRDDAKKRTWPALRIFGKEGPLHQGLVDVLRAYTMYRSDIGYMPGCNTIAALLLLNLDGPAATFVALANALNRPLPLAFFASDYGAQTGVYDLIIRTLAHKSPSLHEHMTSAIGHIPAERYLYGMLASMFTSVLAVDEAARLWDVYVFEGDTVLVRAAVACLLNNEMALLGSRTEDEVCAILRGQKAREAGKEGIAASETEHHFMKSVRDAGKE